MHEPYPKQALVFTCLQYKCFENTVEKGEIGQNQQFPLFKQCFLLILRTFHNFDEIQNYHLQILSGWKSLIFVILERVKPCFLRVWPHTIYCQPLYSVTGYVCNSFNPFPHNDAF